MYSVEIEDHVAEYEKCSDSLRGLLTENLVDGRQSSNGVYDNWYGIQIDMTNYGKRERKQQIAQVVSFLEHVKDITDTLEYFKCEVGINGCTIAMNMNRADLQKGPFHNTLRRLLRLHAVNCAELKVVISEVGDETDIAARYIDRMSR